jgi:hypothetical protein
MTAFLNIDFLCAHACRRVVLRLVGALPPVGWLITPCGRPIGRWRTGNKTTEIPPA